MLVQQIEPSIIVALIGILGGVLPVGITYVATKRKEIDANVRQELTKRYDGLIEAIVMVDRTKPEVDRTKPIVDTSIDEDALDNFIKAYNRAMAYASDLVLERCNVLLIWLINRLYQESEPNDEQMIKQIQQRKTYVGEIYKAIRKDINPKAKFYDILPMATFKQIR